MGSAPGQTGNPVKDIGKQLGLSEKDLKTAGMVLTPGADIAEETLFPVSELEPPGVPSRNLPTEEQIQAEAKKAREFELVRRAGTRGRASTIRTGSRGIAGRAQTTSKVLGG